MAYESVLKSHSLVVPNLDGLVPRSTDDDGSLGVLVELHAGDPVSVSVLFNCELAFSDGVPDLKIFISAAAGNLSVVRRESNREDVSSVANESLHCLALGQVPQSEGSIP